MLSLSASARDKSPSYVYKTSCHVFDVAHNYLKAHTTKRLFRAPYTKSLFVEPFVGGGWGEQGGKLNKNNSLGGQLFIFLPKISGKQAYCGLALKELIFFVNHTYKPKSEPFLNIDIWLRNELKMSQ